MIEFTNYEIIVKLSKIFQLDEIQIRLELNKYKYKIDIFQLYKIIENINEKYRSILFDSYEILEILFVNHDCSIIEKNNMKNFIDIMIMETIDFIQNNDI